MYKSAQKSGENVSGMGILRESRSTSGCSDKSCHIGTALTAEVKGVASAR
jgi:hypothetical protein